MVDWAMLREDSGAAANTARATQGLTLVHLDVDVLDFLDAPTAENV